MHIEYVHASKFGNGARVAETFEHDMAARGIDVAVHHVDAVKRGGLPAADLYVFSSPGRMGRPISSMRKFLKKVELARGARYALLTTEIAPKPDKKTGRMPTEEEICKFQKVRPIMHQLLQARGYVAVAEDVVHVMDLKGPLEDGWEWKVDAFADRIASALSPATESATA
jgi:menaquinone-dependent protoporphyrinogen IX oxidase